MNYHREFFDNLLITLRTSKHYASIDLYSRACLQFMQKIVNRLYTIVEKEYDKEKCLDLIR